MLRQQTAKPAGRPNRCLADYVAPAGDHLGGFAVAIHGAEELAASYEADHDDYRAIMVKALADRLAEAFAEYIHLQARRDWYRAGRRPARSRTCTPSGSAASGPRSATRRARTTARSEPCSTCSTPKQLGMALTESFAMTPAASVSGLLFAHPSLALLHRRPHRPGPGRGLRAAGAAWTSPRSSAGCAPTSPTTRSERRTQLSAPGTGWSRDEGMWSRTLAGRQARRGALGKLENCTVVIP